MGFYELKNRLQTLDPKFGQIKHNTILGELLQQIGQEIDQIKSVSENINNYDVINQSGNQLDDIAQLFNIKRQLFSVYDNNLIISNAVLIQPKDPSYSIINVLQEVYGTQDKFPDILYVSDGNTTLKVIQNFSNQEGLGVYTIILPAQVETYSNQPLLANTELTIVINNEQLNNYFNVKSLRTINELYGIESDENLRARIQTQLQSYQGPTKQWLESQIYSNVSGIRKVLIKNLSRGLQTADIVLFPTISNIYDENMDLISDINTQNQAKESVQNYLPLGTDILFKDAIQRQFTVEITISGINTDDQQTVQNLVKNTIIDYFNNKDVGESYTLTNTEIQSEISKQIILNGYVGIIQQFVLKENGSSITSANINDDEYPVLFSVVVTFN